MRGKECEGEGEDVREKECEGEGEDVRGKVRM